MSKKIVETSLDAFEWISSLEHNVDLIITDIPYPFDNQNGTGRHAYVEGEDEMFSRMGWKEIELFFQQLSLKMNPGGRSYVFSNRDGFQKTIDIMESTGWRYLNTIVWDKERFGGGYHWRNSIEFIHYFCVPKKPKVYVKGARNYLRYPRPTKKSAIPEIRYDPNSNNTPKPWEIWRDIIINGACEGDVVADPFAGSNPLRAAVLLDEKVEEKISLALTNSFDI